MSLVQDKGAFKIGLFTRKQLQHLRKSNRKLTPLVFFSAQEETLENIQVFINQGFVTITETNVRYIGFFNI